jgi:hypothetical protein
MRGRGEKGEGRRKRRERGEGRENKQEKNRPKILWQRLQASVSLLFYP